MLREIFFFLVGIALLLIGIFQFKYITESAKSFYDYLIDKKVYEVKCNNDVKTLVDIKKLIDNDNVDELKKCDYYYEYLSYSKKMFKIYLYLTFAAFITMSLILILLNIEEINRNISNDLGAYLILIVFYGLLQLLPILNAIVNAMISTYIFAQTFYNTSTKKH